MKPSIKLGLATLLLANGVAHAVNPVQAWYAGIMIGGSYLSKTNFNFTVPANPYTPKFTSKANMTYSAFGDIGGQLGYRIDQFRVEGELLLNYSPFSTLRYGNFTLHGSKKSTGVSMKGQTNIGAFMVNGFYDFLSPDDAANFVPYVGAGIGYSTIRSSIKFYNNGVLFTHGTFTDNVSSPIGQLIAGASYFLDDYTSFSLDYRYLTTKAVQPFDNRLRVNSVNLTFNGALCD